MGGPIDIEQSGLEQVIHDHDREYLVTEVRCKDLQYQIVTGVTSDVGVPLTHLVLFYFH